jgi:catechol 2,3-dioxygenase-like lactoylglutathione lyase family enzyme
MKKRVGDPFMAADAYGRSLGPGLGINLIVRDIDAATQFARAVLAAELVYADADFAVLRAQGSQWMLHADHTYLDNPVTGIVGGAETRGAGVELRLYGADPDLAEARARLHGHIVLAGAIDKPHGLRESMIIDPDGYLWVPSVPLGAEPPR